jgi:hypothetical protein
VPWSSGSTRSTTWQRSRNARSAARHSRIGPTDRQYALRLALGRRCFEPVSNEVGVERPEFELDVVRVAKHDHGSPVLLLHA